MDKKKCFIILNQINGYKVVLDDEDHVDCTKPIFHSGDIRDKGLIKCIDYCKNNNLDIIKICR